MASDKDNKKHPEPELTAKKMIPTKEFGLLKVMEWPDGTVIHLNTKKGEENMRIYHSSGSYSEHRSDGTSVSFHSNNGITYSKGGITVTYDNSSDTRAEGHARISLGHDAHIEVAKNASIVVNGRSDVHSTGHLKLSVGGDLQLSSAKGSIVLAAKRDVEIRASEGRVMTHSKSATQITSDADVHIEAKEDVVSKAGGSIYETADGNIAETADGTITEQAKGNIKSKSGGKNEILADGNVVTKGAKTVVQEGGTQMTPTSSDFV